MSGTAHGQAPPARESGPQARLRCVLLVEDNLQVGTMYRHALERLASTDLVALQVESARDGAEALARLGRAPPVALVVTDLYMPNMDGFALLERIRANPALCMLPVLAISSAGPDARERAIELGADVCLQKPVNIADILGAVRQLLAL